jgi:hypothetical protein
MNVTETKRFMMAGNATITVKSCHTQRRYTFKISHPEFLDDGAYFVALLGGPDNNVDYRYMGMMYAKDVGVWYTRLTAKSPVGAATTAWQAFNWFIRALSEAHQRTDRDILSQCEWWHEGTCGACGRKLTVPESIEQGLGPVCAGRV